MIIVARPVGGYLGATVQMIRLPCCIGGDSSLPNSSNLATTWSMTFLPSSMWAKRRAAEDDRNLHLVFVCQRNLRLA